MTSHVRKQDVLTRLKLGHTGLNGNLFRIGCHDSGTCDYCAGQQETTDHVIYDCERYRTNRD